MKMLLRTVREFVDEEVVPLERHFLLHDFETLLPLLDAKRQQAKGLGLWLPQIPAEHGGMGLSLLEHGLVSEILGRSPLGHYVMNCQAPDAGNMEILIEHGTAAQQEQYLFPLLEGEIRSCFSMTEPENPGSNPTWLSTTAVADGDDYVITGHKWFSTGAEGAAFAIVMAVTDPKASKHARASMIIVPTDAPGFRLVRNTSVMGERGAGNFSHAEIMYDGVRVPRANLLGPAGAGFMIAQQRLGPGRIHH
ncbi:MAG: acyl-CoA dehydrogenase family protein, partial [Anaerolineales bacterium]|nr:acyl-CoA dehydrogenase family protein [Anaerolineales bacterium]